MTRKVPPRPDEPPGDGDELRSSRALLDDQREVNERLVGVAIRAEERSDEADAARDRAEANERELRSIADFRETFIGIISHDLRNPLAATVLNVTEMIDRGHLDPVDKKSAARILRATERMIRMIEQLTDLTRARLGGGIRITAVPTDLGVVARQIIDELESGRVRLDVVGDLTGTWDSDRLAQVLSNIVGNALRHARPETEVVVELRADGAEVVATITNLGNPIAPEVMPILFEPFRRGRSLDASTKNLGLGLYIADQIVRAHGGTLAARSSHGTTTFEIRLPRTPS